MILRATSAYELGRRAGQLRVAHATNPFADFTHDHEEWNRGWIRETAALLSGHRG